MGRKKFGEFEIQEHKAATKKKEPVFIKFVVDM